MAKLKDTTINGTLTINFTTINEQNVKDWLKNGHKHDNLETLDQITLTKMSEWDDAARLKHNHSNKSMLDTINLNMGVANSVTFEGVNTTVLKIGSYVEGVSGGGFLVKGVVGDLYTYLEVDKLKVRLKAYFETLEILNINSVGGKQILTPAGAIECIKVEIFSTYYRCYFKNELDGVTIENRFKVGDLAQCKEFNISSGISQGVTNLFYWREVVAVGDDYIDLSVTKCASGSDIPKVGDTIAQLGSVNSDKSRLNALIFSAVDDDSPSIKLHSGINSYSLENTDYVSIGMESDKVTAFLKVYGSMYVGSRNKTGSYLEYKNNELTFKGYMQTTSGKNVETLINNAQSSADTANNSINNLEIGGENLWAYLNTTLTPYLLFTKIMFNPNTTYTFKDYTGILSSGNTAMLGISKTQTSDVSSWILIVKNWSSFTEVTFTTSSSVNGSYYFIIYKSGLRDLFLNSSQKIKLELGNKVSQYSIAVDDLLISDKNLVNGTYSGKGWYYSTLADGVFTRTAYYTGTSGVYSEKIITSSYFSGLKAFDKFVITFDLKKTANVHSTEFFIMCNGSSEFIRKDIYPEDTNWNSYEYVFEALPSWGSGSSEFYVRFDNNGTLDTDNSEISIRKIQILLGSKSSNWKISDKDLEDSIQNAQLYGTRRCVKGEYSSDKTYTAMSQQVDVVIYNGSYYEAIPTLNTTFKNIPPTNTTYWSRYTQSFDNIATGLFFAEEAYIENLIVPNVRTGVRGDGKPTIEITELSNALTMYNSSDEEVLRVSGDLYNDITAFTKTQSTPLIPSISSININARDNWDLNYVGEDLNQYGYQTLTVINVPTTGSYKYTLSSFSLNLNLTEAKPYGTPFTYDTTISLVDVITVNGTSKSTILHSYRHFGTANNVVITIPSQIISPGVHDLQIRYSINYRTYEDEGTLVDSTSKPYLDFQYDIYTLFLLNVKTKTIPTVTGLVFENLVRIFANGMGAKFGTNKYFAIINSSTENLFNMRSTNTMLTLNDTNAYISNDGGLSNLKLTSGALCYAWECLWWDSGTNVNGDVLYNYVYGHGVKNSSGSVVSLNSACDYSIEKKGIFKISIKSGYKLLYGINDCVWVAMPNSAAATNANFVVTPVVKYDSEYIHIYLYNRSGSLVRSPFKLYGFLK